MAGHDASGNREVLERAEFDPKLRTYWFWQSAFVLVVTIVGIAILPFWVLGLGQWWTRRMFDAMEAELTTRSLNYRRGVLFRVEKTIPLEQIQDLTLREGPLLSALGLCSLSVETAGQASSTGSDAQLTGIREARAFRNSVLERRDRLRAAAGGEGGEPRSVEEILTRIHDDVAAIRASLASREEA